MKIYAAINDSANYDWWAFGATEQEARDVFARMWLDWSKISGADPHYWGADFSDVSVFEVESGAGYMDRERYR
jgi:hypothetical protein